MGDEEVAVPGAEAGHIEEVPEFRFFLYRCAAEHIPFCHFSPHLHLMSLVNSYSRDTVHSLFLEDYSGII